MKISPTPSKTVVERTSVGSTTNSAKQAAKYTTPQQSSHAVDLSAAGRQLAQLQSPSHDIDMEKVSAIKLAIAKGELKIDTSNIADSLLATARDLMK
ncbi:flagellar biosynthesis anti-sigma factor FlgM [Alcaligenes endophyticus]|uniref:Negative regulator of flagellin synthesis n=1 Tax=Alcaligenes endophyticus TaxID=1929088 RepID=A0ABT8ELW9_9BURK|nr:flagellar biosynthesis anti-sigma factor FlgM [Alcaligenes endophyticus]MCX5590546.1 flagellar biosynthesis anti-sigma factor FlgM [Alcaligenes endophyticus]MDN4122090.1 flagellar biosynthesis anti-sigma factor FlgM [Alcaligenes endophyticus]